MTTNNPEAESDSTVAAGVRFRKLLTDRDAWKLARDIFRMLTSVGVISTDIQSISVDKGKGMAWVNLRTQEVEQFVLDVFEDISHVMNFFNVRKLTNSPSKLRVRGMSVVADKASPKKRGVTSLELSEDALETTVSGDESSDFEDLQPARNPKEEEKIKLEAVYVAALTDSKNSKTLEDVTLTSSSSTFGLEFDNLSEEECPPVMLNAATSTPALNEVGKVKPTSPCCSRDRVMVDVKTSTPQVSPCFCPDTVFYHKRQIVGIESRHTEFKRGGVVSDLRAFRGVVGRYMCAFLNTEGGTIYFGVTDEGMAIGVRVSQKYEDQIRLTIDNVVSFMKPHVPPSAYTVNFAKIMNDEGQIEENLRVLEVCVKPCVPPEVMHSFDHHTYVRRDGSLRAL